MLNLPTKPDSFFGWFVVGGLFINYMAVIGILIYTLPLFYPFLMAEYNWTAGQVTLGATIGYFTGALLTPLVSPFYDRYPIRLFMAAGIFVIAGSLFFYSAITTVGIMVGLYMLFAVGQVCSGQVPVMIVASRWFEKKRGIAIGIILTATSAGGAVFPLLLRPFLIDGDWQSASKILALLALLMLGLPLLLLIRNSPQELGQNPDGIAPPTLNAAEQADKKGPELREALRSKEFYLLAFATGGLWFIINGMVQHQSIIMVTELAITPARLATIISVFFWFAITGKILFGILADRFNKNLVMLKGVLYLLAGLLVLRIFAASQLYIYAGLFGLGFGGTFAMIQILIADYFAGQHYGKILGLLTMVDVAAGGVGIPALAWLSEKYGSYMPVLNGLIVLAMLIAFSVIILYYIHKAKHHHSTQTK